MIAVDDDPAALAILRLLMPSFVSLQTHCSAQECLDGIDSAAPDIAVLDLRLPDMDGIELLRRLRIACPGLEVILLSADYSTASAVAAIKAGAADYLTKPVETRQFGETLSRSIQAVRVHREFQCAEDQLAAKSAFEGMVGRSPAIRRISEMVRRIGPHFYTAVVTGPSGTGKELVARALHTCAGHGGPYVVCNCAAIPAELAESELFGRAKGAYTGAVVESPGYFGRASGGTLVLDEFTDLPPGAQAALLRAVQFGEIQRLGVPSVVQVHVRIVACTNQDIRACVGSGSLRQDLYYRLGVFELTLPSLAQRREDIPLLVRHFLNRYAKEIHKEITGLTPAAEQLLLDHQWPGNVRELEQVIHYGVVMARSNWIDGYDLPEYLSLRGSVRQPSYSGSETNRADAESRHVLEVLSQAGGDKRKAASLLGVSRATLYRLLQRAKSPVGLGR